MVGFLLVFEAVSIGWVCVGVRGSRRWLGLCWCLRQSVMVGFVLVFEVVSDGGVCVGV